MARRTRTLLAICLFVALAEAATAQTDPPCEDEDCLANPIVGDLSKTLPPVPTPSTQKPDLKVLGSGLVQEIRCAAPGRSTSGLTTCPARDRTSNIRVMNNGRIDIVVYFIRPNGSLQRRFTLRPGFTRRVANPTCVGHRWLVRSTCGRCMTVLRVTNTAAAVVEVSNDGVEASCPGPAGQWSNVRRWQNNVIAAGLANVPGSNRVLGFSAVQEGSFNRDRPDRNPRPPARKTQVEIFDYVSNTFRENDLIGHNMFCAAITLLPDGKLFAQGGGAGDDGRLVSTFDPFAGPNGRWSRHTDTNNGHWYGTVVVTKEQNLLLALGVDTKEVGFREWARQLDYPELSRGFNLDRPWRNMTGVDMDGKQPDNLHWYPVMHLMPNGDILESGTMNNMWRIRTAGAGSIRFAGRRNTRRNENESWGASTIMYDEGKLLTIGGIENWVNDRSSGRFVYRRAITIDMNNANNIRTAETDDMAYPRAFVNTVVLPSGEVVAVGGKNNINQWDDTLSVKAVELWNPNTGKWTLLAEHRNPRNYHAAAILLRDGRVLSSGGGLCPTCHEPDVNGDILNYPTHEIFSPPYLFNRRGQRKTRPVIVNSPATTRTGNTIRIVVGGPRAALIERVSIVKQCAVTHTISTDARQLRLQIVSKARRPNNRYLYTVRANSNIHVMTPGYWFLFVLDNTGTPSVAKDMRVLT